MLTGKTSWLSISNHSIFSFFTWWDGTFAIQHSQACKWEDHACKPISLACGAHLIFKQACSKLEMPINCKQERQCCYSMYSILPSNVILTFYFYFLTSADLITITVEVPAMVKITVYIRTCIIFPLEFKWASLLQLLIHCMSRSLGCYKIRGARLHRMAYSRHAHYAYLFQNCTYLIWIFNFRISFLKTIHND